MICTGCRRDLAVSMHAVLVARLCRARGLRLVLSGLSLVKTMNTRKGSCLKSRHGMPRACDDFVFLSIFCECRFPTFFCAGGGEDIHHSIPESEGRWMIRSRYRSGSAVPSGFSVLYCIETDWGQPCTAPMEANNNIELGSEIREYSQGQRNQQPNQQPSMGSDA